jgi:flagellar hook-length control protein FliK
MRIDVPKNNNNDIQRDRLQTNQTQNGFSTIEENDDLPSDFANIFESVLNKDDEKKETKSKAREDSNNIEKDKSESGDGHKIVSEKKDDSDNGNGGNAETNAGLAGFQAQLNEIKTIQGDSIPARAILHIADVERIVSSVRTQLGENGLPQITIDLKRSILEGLQIKLSTDQNGKIIAEFIASSEKVKSMIDAKNKELTEILENRGIQISNIKTSISDSSTNSNKQNQPDENNFGFNKLNKAIKSEKIEEEVEKVSDTSLKNVYRA